MYIEENTMLIGYARVSSYEQNLELQIDALENVGCAKIFSDKISGIKTERHGLDNALSHLRPGDTFVIWKLDRLDRTVKRLIELLEKLEEKGVNFYSITDGINTTTPAGRCFFHIMASLAQMERELLVERTRAGLAVAKKRGRVGGRKRVMTSSKLEAAKKLLSEGMPPKEVAQNLGVSIPTLYRWCPASDRA